MTLSAGATLGPYEVVELLGAGGMGEVYRARDSRLGREVAVKVLPPEMATEPERLQRFEREAKAVASLNHPHILTVYDVGTDDGSAYVATELLEGETLRETLDRRSPTQKQVLSFAVQAAQGIAAAHRKGVIHRDLKPENLFVSTEGHLKILDFGLAKLTAPEASGATTGTTDTGTTRPGVLMDTVAYMSPEQVEALPADARSDIFSFGVVLHELLSTRHPFRRETVAETLTAILHGTPPDLGSQATGIAPALSGIVGRCLEKRPEDRFQTSHDLALALEAMLQAPTGAAALQELEERSPYPGLQSFTEKDAGVFFGREGEVQELWGRLRSRKLLAVIGPSGVGKTSFVRAGVVASRPAGWGTIVATPGAQPFRSLGRALGPELAGDAEALTKIVDFEDPETAFDLLSRWRKGQEEALLILDQFEELFTLNPPEVQERFAGLLGRLAREADVHVLLSFRDDFLIRCCEQQTIAPVLRELTALLSLKPEDLRRALVEPAKKQGYRFEDEALVEEMAQSVEGARAALPLLAFAVSRLWERRDREKKLLRRESYEAIGGVAGALAQHAEQTLDRIGMERQGLVREVFRNLVTSQGTRTVADREELLSVFADKRESAAEVLKALVDGRLLTSYEATELPSEAPGGPGSAPSSRGARSGLGDEGSPGLDRSHRIEIAHESLLKAWPRLVRWQTQDEDGAQLRDQLRQAAHLWEEKSRSPDVLWSGTALQEFELWQERYPGKLTVVEEDFAHSMVERDRRRKKLRRALVAVAFVVLAGVAAAIAVSRGREAEARMRAESEALRAEASKLLAIAQLRLEDDPTEALAYATASLELSDTAEARRFGLRALWEAPPALETEGRGWVPSFSPDGSHLAVSGNGPEVGLWAEDGKGPVVLPGHQMNTRGPQYLRWTSTGHLVAGWPALAERVDVWSVPEGKRLRRIEFGQPSFWEVGPDHLLAETIDPMPASEVSVHKAWDQSAGPIQLLLRSWPLPDGEPEVLGRVNVTALGARKSFLTPSGRSWLYVKDREVWRRPLPVGVGRDRVFLRLAAPLARWNVTDRVDELFFDDARGAIEIWSFTSEPPRRVRVIARPVNGPKAPNFDSSGRWLAKSAPIDSELRLWPLTEALPGARPWTLRRGGRVYVSGFAFHPSGEWVVNSTRDNTRVTFWPLRRAYPSVVEGYATITRSAAFSPDGRWLATTWADRSLRIWPLPGTDGNVRIFEGLPARRIWRGLQFDAESRNLIAVGSRGAAWVIPLDGSSPRPLSGFSDQTILQGVAISPSGRRAATAFGFGQGTRVLRVWDLETGKARVFELPEPADGAADAGYFGAILSLRFSDESTLLTAGHGGIRRWNVDDGSQELLVGTEPGRPFLNMNATDDGRTALVQAFPNPSEGAWSGSVSAQDLVSGSSRPLPAFGSAVVPIALDPSGSIAVTGDDDGVVRVGRVSGAEPHVLLGHAGAIDSVALSPDLRWIASTGEDDTLRLWPMPDLDKPPLHTLPREELMAKLKSLTNIRAVRDPEAPNGWSIELDPFPGWKDVPTW